MSRNAYMLLLLTTLMWAGNSIAGKLAIGHISPMMLTTLRWATALTLLVAIGGRQLRRDWPVVRANLPLLLALGMSGFTLFNIFFYSALQYTTAINVSILQAGIPMFIFALNFLLYRIGVSIGQIIGFSLTLLGVALTASHGDIASLARLDINFGDALMLFAVVFYAGYTVALRYRPVMHWKSLMVTLSFAAFVTSLPFAAWEIAAGNAIWPDARGWAVITYTAVFPSVVSQVLYIRGVELIGANRAGLFINLVPIFGTLLSVLMLSETFYIHHAVAMVMVIGGIALAEHSGRKRADSAVPPA